MSMSLIIVGLLQMPIMKILGQVKFTLMQKSVHTTTISHTASLYVV